MSRRTAREAAMRLLYEYSIKNELGHKTLYDMADVFEVNKLSEENMSYIDFVVNEFLLHKDEIDKYISDNSHTWTIDRISKVDLSILRLALFEIFFTGVPKNIICNEAVEIAKKYSSKKSASYINGVLGGILKGMDSADS